MKNVTIMTVLAFSLISLVQVLATTSTNKVDLPKPMTVRCLTSEGGASPAFCPDGKCIIYVKTLEDGHQELRQLDIVSGKESLIIKMNSIQNPIYSPDGKCIAFLSGPVFNRQIWIVKPCDSKPFQITKVPATRSSLNWIEEGKKLAFVQGLGNAQHVVSLDPHSKDSMPVRLPQTGIGRPIFSPKGKLLALITMDSRGRSNISVFARDGKRIVDIPSVEGTDNNIRGCYDPAFSPNERYMVYVRSSIQPLSDLYLRDLVTQKEVKLTNDGFDNQMPVFAPDGKSIAFVAAMKGQAHRIYLMSLDGIEDSFVQNYDESKKNSKQTKVSYQEKCD